MKLEEPLFVVFITGERGIESWTINGAMLDELEVTLVKGRKGKVKKSISAGFIKYRKEEKREDESGV